MFDHALRPIKARLLSPVVRAMAPVPADAVTAVGLGVGVAAGWLAAWGRFDLALAAWWLNRLLDGLDGELARASRRRARTDAGPDAGAGPLAGGPQAVRGAAAAGAPSARGAYLDLMADLAVYAAVPIGLAAGAAGTLTGSPLVEPHAAWSAVAATLAAFYLNLGSWALLSAAWPPTAELAAPASTADPHATGLRMPAGLMEGGETIVAFSVALAWPAGAVVTLSTMAALTLIGAIQRTLWAARRLGRA